VSYYMSPPYPERCTGIVTLRDGSTADCMRKCSKGSGEFCYLHDPAKAARRHIQARKNAACRNRTDDGVFFEGPNKERV